MKMANHLDMDQNQILRLVLENLATAPSTPVEGQVYYNTADDAPYIRIGSAWVSMKQGLTSVAWDDISDGPSSTPAQVDAAVTASHGHTNKTLLDSYTQTEANLASAVTNNHTHANKTLLDTYTQTEANIASAVTNNHTHTNKSTLDSYTQTEVNLADAVSKKHSHVNQATLDTYTQSETNLSDAVSKKHTQNTDTGTSSSTFMIGTSGPKIKNSSGEVQIRNNADSDFADLRVKNLHVEGTTTEINSTTVDIGDSELLLNSEISTAASNSDGGIAVKRLQSDNSTPGNAKMVFNESTDRWEAVFGAPDSLVTATVATKVSVAIGDGENTSYIITHNLNTRDLSVSIREVASPYELVMATVKFTSVNTITVEFGKVATASQYQVTIIG